MEAKSREARLDPVAPPYYEATAAMLAKRGHGVASCSLPIHRNMLMQLNDSDRDN